MNLEQIPCYLIDSNIILDVLLQQQHSHVEWSNRILSKCAEQGVLAINQIIYAEVAYAFYDIQELERAMLDYQRLSLPWEAGFVASKAYAAYRKKGGQRQTLMPDFYIGAHALFSGLTLVTRDKGYSNYFPGLKIIQPA